MKELNYNIGTFSGILSRFGMSNLKKMAISF